VIRYRLDGQTMCDDAKVLREGSETQEFFSGTGALPDPARDGSFRDAPDTRMRAGRRIS
jgi:hypothetical protein